MSPERVSGVTGRFVRLASAIGLLVSLLVLVGWAFGVPTLTSMVPGWPRMAALTAALFVLTSVALWLAASQPLPTAQPTADGLVGVLRQRFSLACAVLIVVIGLMRLVAHLFDWNVGRLDSVGLPGLSSAPAYPMAGSMAPATALGFVLLGGALLLAQQTRLTRLYQTLISLALSVGWLGFARYVFGGAPLIPLSNMAMHTALLFMILGAGVLGLRRDVGLTALLLDDGAGGASFRHLLPAALLIPLVAGMLALYSQRWGWLGMEAGMSLFALSSMAVFAGLVWANAARLKRTDQGRQRAEMALRESQQLLQTIVDNSQAVVYVKDLDGRYLLVNRRFEEIFHLGREYILGRTDHDLFSKEAADRFRDMDMRVAAADHALTEEETAPQTDGIHAYISVKAPLRDASGKTHGVFGISTDITDRKRDEDRLRAQLARLNLLDETTRAIGERHDLRSIFQVVIRSLEEYLPIDFGCVCLYDPAEQVLSVTCVGAKSQALALDVAFSEHARLAVDDNGLGRCVRGQLVYESEIENSRFPFPARLARGGLRSLVFAPLMVESKVFGVMIAARRGAGGFTSGDCEFLRQLSGHVALAAHQSQLYTALEGAYEDLRQTQQAVMQQERLRALGQMASGIAHDINNALSPAALYVQSLLDRDRTLSVEARNHLEITERAIENVANTVTRMREFSRPREPQLILAPVNINGMLQQVADLTHARWSDMPQERGILVRLQREFQERLPPIPGAESEIRDALINLVLNAVDAMPEGGTLTLRSRLDSGTPSLGVPAPVARVLVEVCDTGIGMTEDVRNRCLEPFFTTKGERGTGLGLAMVYGMIRRHNAELEIDSEPGVGTTVRLIFSVTAMPAESVKAADVRLPKPLRILLVDDDPLVLQSLHLILKQDQHLVTMADGGQAGIDEFCEALRRGVPFDAVITDLGMPNIDGRTVAAAIKSRAPAMPVILLTGWGHRLRSEGDLPQHVDHVLSKPPKLHELRAALAQLTDELTL